MAEKNSPVINTADSQKTRLSRLLARCSAFVALVFPNLSKKSPILSKVLSVVLMSLIVLLISVFLTLSATSCGTTTKAVVQNSKAQTTITITTSQDPTVNTEGSIPVQINPSKSD